MAIVLKTIGLKRSVGSNPTVSSNVGVSSNGKTPGFGSGYGGSIPSTPANYNLWPHGEMVDTGDLKSLSERSIGSSPFEATN